MRSPLKPLPEFVDRWARRVRWLRWLDLVVGWVVVWLAGLLVVESLDATDAAIISALLVGAIASIRPVRARWRPVTALVALNVSRRLRPGDRAWYVVHPAEVQLVIVTARRGLRLVIAGRAEADREVTTVRRTRALLLPADE